MPCIDALIRCFSSSAAGHAMFAYCPLTHALDGTFTMNFWNAGQKVISRVLNTDAAGRPRMKLLDTEHAAGHEFCEMRVRTMNTHVDLWVRNGTTDLDLLAMILGNQSMYDLPDAIEPKVIFDIGANIGIASVYFAMRYPKATIYSFEPLPENQILLQRNTEIFANIHIMPFGLSDRAGTFTYCMSNNANSYGGGTFCNVGHNPERAIELPVKTATTVINDLGIEQVDILKIDTEGSEYAILQGIPENIVTTAQAYIGELHGIGDWQFCEKLSKTHHVGIDKRFNARCFPFLAVRKDLAATGSEQSEAA